MAINSLTNADCKAAKCPAGQKSGKLFDGQGLHLYVTPAGSKHWRMAYRFAGKPQTATFGAYPEVSLADARKKRDALRLIVQADTNPKATVAPIEISAPPSMTLREGMQAYWAARENITDRYRQNAIRAFEHHLPAILDKPMAVIDRAMLMEELRKLDAAKRFVYVRRVRMWAGMIFDWARERREETGVSSNPANEINPQRAFGKATVKPHASLSLAQLPGFMQRLASENQAMQSVLACRLIALTWVRTQEVRLMEFSELEQDDTVWRVGAAKMKMRNEHLVPLSRQAKEIVATMRERSHGSKYVFPCDAGRRLDRPMSENSVLYLIGRMGYEKKMTGHGWRTIVSTWANESGLFGPDAIERQLAHTPSDKVRAAYNRAAYLSERTRMMQLWADWLEEASQPDATGNA